MRRMAQPDHIPAAAQDKSPLVRPAPALSRAIQDRIGNELRAMYRDKFMRARTAAYY
jgi:hypothetical protein